MRGILGGALAIAVAAVLPVAAAAEPVVDLSIVRVTYPSSHRIGTIVRVTVVARNEGPDVPQSLDVTGADSGTLQLLSATCQGVSSDGPFCEYGRVPAGETRRTRLTFLVVGSVDGVASTTACVTAEEFPNPDPNPANDCVPITIAVR
jgi:hypothetical protein